MPKGVKPPKPKKCKCCPEKFIPRNTLHTTCSTECAIQLANQKSERKTKRLEKAERDDLRARREKLKTKSDWAKEAQVAVNRYIFWRDFGRPCIACGRQLNYGVRGGAVDASHYRSRGSASHLRYNVFNIHAGCVRCNRELSGNLIPFRINLIEKIGANRVEVIEHDNTPRKFDIDYLKRVKAIFTRRARHFEKLRKRHLEAA